MKLRRRELQVVKAGWIVSMVILLKVITFALCIKQSPFSSSNPLSLSLSHQLREGNDRVLRGRRCRLKVEEEAHEETEEEAQEDETAIQVVCASMPIHKSLNLYVLCHYIYVGIIVCRTWTKNGRFSVHSSIRQREHMRRDAMAGLHVLRLMPEPTAVALLTLMDAEYLEEEAHEETEEEAQEDETVIQDKNGRTSVHSSIRQREHMRRDAMAGVHVLRLMPEPTAVALLYAQQ
ncbi:hypothetical protein F2Q70_00034571 [Brassica cretica]|uniref:Uncharacterized protein n=1 Tax=Brassica cretica TaxID=69181 RepID=A0A8S9JUW1_BRACR|nr:hypothetical protein F2Q70_00034571 [Brassica cretica]